MEGGNFDVGKEKAEREEQYLRLKELSGFDELSPKQQQMIKMSLYANQRAFRETDEASAKNIGTHPVTGSRNIDFTKEFWANRRKNDEDPEYAESQMHIYDWYCHAVVGAVESEDMNNPDGYSIKSPLESHRVESDDDLEAFIELELDTREMPVILRLVTEPGPHEQGHRVTLHSALILGKDENNNYWAWEKRGYGLEYGLIPLEEILKDYEEVPRVMWEVEKFGIEEDVPEQREAA